MKKVKVKFKMQAVTLGYSYAPSSEAELETTENLAHAIAYDRVELIGDCPSDFKKKVFEIKESLKNANKQTKY